MKIYKPFRKPFRDPDSELLQPMIIVVTKDERESVLEYLDKLAGDELVDIHASGFIVIDEGDLDKAYCIANRKKGFGWYGEDIQS